MKKLLVLLLFVVCCAAPAQGTLLLYDGFEYTAGQLLAPTNDTTGSPNPGQLNVAYGVNWRYAGAGNPTTQTPPAVAANGLSYPGLLAATGNSATFDSGDVGSARIGFAVQSSGTVYWSGMLRVNDVGTLATAISGGPALNGYLVGGLNNTQGAGTLPTVVGAVLRIRGDAADPSRYFIGTGMNSGTGTGAGGTNVQFEATSRSESPNTTVFVVASYTFVAGTTNDIARMWINPDPSTFGGADPLPASATLTSAPGASVADSSASVNSFNLRQVNTVGAPDFQFDELRIGTTWADVTPAAVPEAGSFMLLLAAGGLVAGRKKLVMPVLSRLASASRAL